MRPIESRITISAPRDEVYEFIADIANRVAWMDHFLKDFRLTRVHAHGVGAGAAFKVDSPLFPLRAEYQVIEAEAPRWLVERGRIGRWGRTTGFTECGGEDLNDPKQKCYLWYLGNELRSVLVHVVGPTCCLLVIFLHL